MTQKKQNFTLPILVMFMLFFMIAFVTNLAGSMGKILQNQFEVSNALAQLGTLANFIAYACMGIPAGIILKRKGYKFTSLLAVVIGFVGVGIQFLAGTAAPESAFAIYVAGAFVAGFSMCLLNIVVNPMLNTLGGGGNRGNQLVQTGGTLNSLGGTITPILVGYLVGGNVDTASIGDASPVMIIAMATFALAFVVITLTRIPEPHMESAEEKAARIVAKAEGKKEKYSALSFRHFVLGAIAIFCYVGIEVGIPSTADLYMSKLAEVGPEISGTVVGVYWFLMLVGRTIGAVVGAKVSSRAMMTTVCAVAMCFMLCIMYIPETMLVTIPIVAVKVPLGMFFMALTGLCTSVMWGAIFNLATEGLGKYTPMASGIFMALVCGGGIIPFLQGLLADGVGYLGSYWLPFAGLAYLLFFALVGSKNVNKDIPVE